MDRILSFAIATFITASILPAQDVLTDRYKQIRQTVTVPLPSLPTPPAIPSKDAPVDRALEAVRSAADSGDDGTIIEALDHDYPAVTSAALKIVTEKRMRIAMPKLIEMYAWLNSPDGGPIFTGDGPYWDEERDPTALELSVDVIAAIDSITGGAIPKPRDKTDAERTRYLKDIKAWWHSASKTRSGSAPLPVAGTSE